MTYDIDNRIDTYTETKITKQQHYKLLLSRK